MLQRASRDTSFNQSECTIFIWNCHRIVRVYGEHADHLTTTKAPLAYRFNTKILTVQVLQKRETFKINKQDWILNWQKKSQMF